MMLSITALAIFLSNSSNALCVASSVSWRPALFFGGGGGGRQPFAAAAANKKIKGLPPGTKKSKASEAIDVRGGGIVNKKSPEEQTLENYLSSSSTTNKKFYVQGWRWHTMSVIREAERLQKLAQQQQQQQQQQSDATTDVTRLQQAADYVVDFNLKALHRVEKMFFPKMRQWMKDSASGGADSEAASSPGPEISQAFDKVISDLEQDQKKMAELGKKITHSLSSSSNNSNVARTVADQSGELVSLAKSMLHREIHLIMPTVARCVPEKEQKKFNNQVIKFLGVLESRVHLVHMHEVVEETKSKLEQQLWEESIPSLPRSMIPRWKRTLYEPKAGALVMP